MLRDALADLAADGLKRCPNPDCLRVLPVTDFYRASRRDGCQTYCKDCMEAGRGPKTPDQLTREAERMREKRASLTPAERASRRAAGRIRDRQKYAALSLEQKAAISKRQRDRRLANPPTAEQRAAKNQRTRERAAGWTAERRAARREQARALAQAKRALWTPEEREAAAAYHRDRERTRRAARTPEQRAAYTLRGSATRLGFDPDAIEAHFVSHSGLCDICGRSASEDNDRFRRLSIDHDHETGGFRGLLCGSCNLAIGKMGDSPERLLAAAEYLFKTKGSPRPPGGPGVS